MDERTKYNDGYRDGTQDTNMWWMKLIGGWVVGIMTGGILTLTWHLWSKTL